MRRLNKSKKGDGGLSSTMVMMTAALIGLFVLILVTGQFGKLFKSVTGKNECMMQYIASSTLKTQGVSTWEPSCEPHLITIDKKYLENNRERAKKEINNYYTKGVEKFGLSPAFNGYKTYFWDNIENPSIQNEWVIDEALAKEMKYCWDITGNGRLDLFSSWTGMIQCASENDPGKFHPCSSNEMEKMYADNRKLAIASSAAGAVIGYKTGGIIFGGVSGALAGEAAPLIYEWFNGNVETNFFGTPPTFCALCARVKFEEGINEKGSVGLWLQNTPVITTSSGDLSKMSYAQYLENDNFREMLVGPKSYPYFTDKSYAVVYARINTYQSEKLFMNGLKGANSVLSSKDRFNSASDIQMIKLVPYQNLKNECTVLVG